MTVKKTTERARMSRRQDKAADSDHSKFHEEEASNSYYETVYGVRYPKQVIAVSLAKALVLE